MKGMIEQLIDEFLTPKLRSVCTCDQMEPGKVDQPYEFVQCKKCGGWLPRSYMHCYPENVAQK